MGIATNLLLAVHGHGRLGPPAGDGEGRRPRDAAEGTRSASQTRQRHGWLETKLCVVVGGAGITKREQRLVVRSSMAANATWGSARIQQKRKEEEAEEVAAQVEEGGPSRSFWREPRRRACVNGDDTTRPSFPERDGECRI